MRSPSKTILDQDGSDTHPDGTQRQKKNTTSTDDSSSPSETLAGASNRSNDELNHRFDQTTSGL